TEVALYSPLALGWPPSAFRLPTRLPLATIAFSTWLPFANVVAALPVVATPLKLALVWSVKAAITFQPVMPAVPDSVSNSEVVEFDAPPSKNVWLDAWNGVSVGVVPVLGLLSQVLIEPRSRVYRLVPFHTLRIRLP